MPWWKLAAKIILGLILLVIIVGCGLFGYICFKAQAPKWGAGCLAALVACASLFYLVVIWW